MVWISKWPAFYNDICLLLSLKFETHGLEHINNNILIQDMVYFLRSKLPLFVRNMENSGNNVLARSLFFQVFTCICEDLKGHWQVFKCFLLSLNTKFVHYRNVKNDKRLYSFHLRWKIFIGSWSLLKSFLISVTRDQTIYLSWYYAEEIDDILNLYLDMSLKKTYKM